MRSHRERYHRDLITDKTRCPPVSRRLIPERAVLTPAVSLPIFRTGLNVALL